jgi:tetrahydromethanopterin S-methyltransferase subunit G
MSKTKKEMQDAMLVVLKNLKKFKVDEAEFEQNQKFYDKQKEKIQNMACELSALINVCVK